MPDSLAPSQHGNHTRNPMTTPAEKFSSLSRGERNRLRLLNEKLSATEEWIRQRHARILEWYRGAGSLHRHGGTSREDVETEVRVQCILREDHADWRQVDDNIVATLLLPQGCLNEHSSLCNWNEFRNWDGHPLQPEHHCWLFHDLADHVLKYDWDALLGIGEIWTDVALIQQRVESW